MVHRLATPTRLLHTIIPLQPMGIGILITDHGTTPITDTVGIMNHGIMVTTDIDGKKHFIGFTLMQTEFYYT